MGDLSEPAVEIFFSEADSVPKDICKDAEANGQTPDVPEELVHDVEVVSSAGLNNVGEDVPSLADASGQDKVLKKPDQILPCPRCRSSNTKFCYYNNHNVNQPRHFCKNCQRYWTAGGTMRNVPVGAGRRKTKHSMQRQPLFGAVSSPMGPLMGNEVVMKPGGENNKEPSRTSLVTLNCAESDVSKFEAHKEQATSSGCSSGLRPLHPLQGLPGPPWAYSLGQGCNNVAAMTPNQTSDNAIQNLAPWGAPMILGAPALCVPAIPFPFMPPSFWACMSSWHNDVLNVPWRGPINGLSSSSSVRSNDGSSANDRPLGKHARDGNLQKDEVTKKKTLWIPKTLRIDDPEEAAKSSIWSTLGIRPDESIKRGNLFRGFQLNNETSGYAPNAAQALHANPAALSRSQIFQERT